MTWRRRAWQRELDEISGQPSHGRAIELAGSRSPEVRSALAAQASTPIGVLVMLSHDRRSGVRAAVASNPSVVVSASTVRRLAQDADLHVVRAVAANPAMQWEPVYAA